MKYVNAALTVLCLLFFLQWGLSFDAPVTFPDSESYLVFKDRILAGTLVNTSLPDVSRAFRTPGYPILLALADLIMPGNGGQYVLMHLVFGIITACVLAWSLKSFVPTSLTMLAVLLLAHDMRQFFPAILTEWIGIQLVLLFFAGVVRYFARPSWVTLAWITLVVAFAVLVRPALQYLTIVPILLVFFGRFGNIAIRASATLPGLLVVLTWCAVNFFSLGRFTLSAFEGANIFGVASLIGFAESEPGDSDDFKEFVSYVNAGKMPRPNEEAEFVESQVDDIKNNFYNDNIYRLALFSPPAQIKGVVVANDLMRKYAMRVFKKHPNRLATYIWVQFKLALGHDWLLIVALLISVSASFFIELRPIAISSAMMVALHLVNVLVVSAVQRMIFRYTYVSLYPLGLAAALTSAALCLRLYRTKESRHI